MFVQDRDSARRFFLDTWSRHKSMVMLEPLEKLVIGVILEHPEYHPLLDDLDGAMSFGTEPGSGSENPFMHMGMHIAIREQVQADRPMGITKLYSAMIARGHTDQHNLEHKMMECLGGSLWRAQRENRLPDENEYLECIKKLG